jgi:hypothetical protein
MVSGFIGCKDKKINPIPSVKSVKMHPSINLLSSTLYNLDATRHNFLVLEANTMLIPDAIVFLVLLVFQPQKECGAAGFYNRRHRMHQ